MVVNAPGALGIPSIALAAYRNAEQKMAVAAPSCGISWNLLAGIGRIESGHAGGGAVDARGTAVVPIYGPALDGTLPGNEVIISSSVGNRVTYARAMGPMQFLPGTWARYATDGKGDGVADPQNLFDSTLAAARYLCSGGLNLRDPSQVMAAILRYNNSMSYAQNVLGWAAAYATGVVPVDLPPITGPPPPLGDCHDEHPEGLGPSLPMNINGLPMDDPISRMPLIDLSPQQLPSQAPMFPWMTPDHAVADTDPNARLHPDLHRRRKTRRPGRPTLDEPTAARRPAVGTAAARRPTAAVRRPHPRSPPRIRRPAQRPAAPAPALRRPARPRDRPKPRPRPNRPARSRRRRPTPPAVRRPARLTGPPASSADTRAAYTRR